MDTLFSFHARIRISERLHMEKEEIFQLFHEGRYVMLGVDGESNKVHKLFYSHIDNAWFVAVQDQKNGEVVTVLPINYHGRWRISPTALFRAKAISQGDIVKEPEPQVTAIVNCEPHFWFWATTENQLYRRNVIKLGSIPRSADHSIAYLLTYPPEIVAAFTRLVQEKVDSNSKIVFVAAGIGSKGSRIALELRSLGL